MPYADDINETLRKILGRSLEFMIIMVAGMVKHYTHNPTFLFIFYDRANQMAPRRVNASNDYEQELLRTCYAVVQKIWKVLQVKYAVGKRAVHHP